MPNGRCRMHGGATPRGAALPQTKHGRYSKDLPTRLLATYERSERDPKLLELSSEIALVDSRIGELLQGIDTGEAGRIWQGLQAAKENFLKARAKGDNAQAAAALSALLRQIDKGTAQWAIWSDILGTVERRRRLVESEMRRQKDLQAMYQVSEVHAMLLTILATLTERNADPDLLEAVKGTIRPILAGGSSGLA